MDLVKDFPMQVLGAIRIQNGTMLDLANYKLAFTRFVPRQYFVAHSFTITNFSY
jgi:hypothetical protein